MTDLVVDLIDAGGYWGIAFLMFLENVFPPVPSELIMGIGGIRAGQGRMDLLPLLLFGTIGTTLGNYFWYAVGRWWGLRGLRPFIARFGCILTLEWEDIERINRLFHRYGSGIVFTFRFMPAFRTMVSLPAGLFHMGQVRFLAWTAAGATIWNAALLAAGWYLGRRFDRIDEVLGPATWVMVAVAAIIYVWRLITWRPRET